MFAVTTFTQVGGVARTKFAFVSDPSLNCSCSIDSSCGCTEGSALSNASEALDSGIGSNAASVSVDKDKIYKCIQLRTLRNNSKYRMRVPFTNIARLYVFQYLDHAKTCLAAIWLIFSQSLDSYWNNLLLMDWYFYNLFSA